MPNPELLPLSRITIHGVTYEIKDAAARRGQTYHLATEASNTPAGVVWIDTSTTPQTTVTGTLSAWNTETDAPRQGVYLVPDNLSNEAQDIYGEWVAVSTSSTPSSATTIWEKLGDTSINWDELIRHLVATVNPSYTSVLGANTQISAAQSTTSMQYGTDSFVKSYPGTKSKLETTTVKGVGNDITFNAVSSDPGATSVHNIVLGTATKASKIETETKEATKLVLGTDTTASKATAGENITGIAEKDTSHNISYINASSVLESATYDSTTETLVIGSVDVSNGTVIGVKDTTKTITPYTFQDVTVPVVTSNTAVNVASVKTNTDITVPVVSSDTSVNLSNPITLASKTAATSAANPTTVATGSLDAADAVGAEIMTGLGTAVTAAALNTLGTGSNTANGTAAAQTITVDPAGAVNVLNGNTTVTLSHDATAGTNHAHNS